MVARLSAPVQTDPGAYCPSQYVPGMALPLVHHLVQPCSLSVMCRLSSSYKVRTVDVRKKAGVDTCISFCIKSYGEWKMLRSVAYLCLLTPEASNHNGRP